MTTEPTTAPAQKLDLAWPGTHLDRLEWRRSIVAIESPLQARIAELEAGIITLLEFMDSFSWPTPNSAFGPAFANLRALLAPAQEGPHD